MTMGERIRRLREKENMSQEALGQCLGVGKTAIFKYEQGEVVNIPRHKIEKMARLFNVTPDYILAYSDDEKELYLSDEMLKDFIIGKCGADALNLLEKFSMLTDPYKRKLLMLCEEFEKAQMYDEMMAVGNRKM